MINFERVCWLDLETTGTSAYRNTIVQMGAIFQWKDKIVDTISTVVQPVPNKEVDIRAEQVTGLTPEITSKGMDPWELRKQITNITNKCKSRGQRDARFIIAGYNVDFDWRFLKQWFADLGYDKYFWFAFWPYKLDIMNLVVQKGVMGSKDIPQLENLKLTTLAEAFGIKYKAHDAMEDIRITREIFYKLVFKEVIDG